MAEGYQSGDTPKKKDEDDDDEKLGAVGGPPRNSSQPRNSPLASPLLNNIRHPQFVIQDNEVLPKDEVSHVREQTGQIFRGFFATRFDMEMRSNTLPEGTPSVDWSGEQRPDPMSLEAQIGMKLANFGDEINIIYGAKFTQLVTLLNPNDENAKQIMERVANIIFKDGVINWGRVLAIFYLGYRIAVDRIKHGSREFLASVVSLLMKILGFQNIFQWVADQGGWNAVLHLSVNYVWNQPPATFYMGSAVAVVTLAAVAYFIYTRKSS